MRVPAAQSSVGAVALGGGKIVGTFARRTVENKEGLLAGWSGVLSRCLAPTPYCRWKPASTCCLPHSSQRIGMSEVNAVYGGLRLRANEGKRHADGAGMILGEQRKGRTDGRSSMAVNARECAFVCTGRW